MAKKTATPPRRGVGWRWIPRAEGCAKNPTFQAMRMQMGVKIRAAASAAAKAARTLFTKILCSRPRYPCAGAHLR
jgi:hypothetical protein